MRNLHSTCHKSRRFPTSSTDNPSYPTGKRALSCELTSTLAYVVLFLQVASLEDESRLSTYSLAVLTPILPLIVKCRCFILRRGWQIECRLDLTTSALSTAYSVQAWVVTGVPLSGNAMIAWSLSSTLLILSTAARNEPILLTTFYRKPVF